MIPSKWSLNCFGSIFPSPFDGAFQLLILNLRNALYISPNLPDLLASQHSTKIPSHHSLSILRKKIFCSLLASLTLSLASTTYIASSSFLHSLNLWRNFPLCLYLSTNLSLSLAAFPILPLSISSSSSFPIIHGFSTLLPASTHASLDAVPMTPLSLLHSMVLTGPGKRWTVISLLCTSPALSPCDPRDGRADTSPTHAASEGTEMRDPGGPLAKDLLRGHSDDYKLGRPHYSEVDTGCPLL